MAFDVLKDTAATAVFLPAERWTTATAAILSPAGASLATPTPTLDAVDTTISSAADVFTLVVASATGINVGDSYQIAADGWTSISMVAQVDSTTITLVDPLPEVPAASDTFKGVQFTVAITSAESATLGVNHRVLIENGNDQMSQMWHVVRTKFDDPMTSQRLRRLIAYKWPSFVVGFEAALLDSIASDVNAEVRRRLMASGRYPQLFGDGEALRKVGLLQSKIELIDHGLIEPNADVDEYRKSLHFEMRDRMGEVITSLTAYDSDDDGSESDEDRRRYTAVLLKR